MARDHARGNETLDLAVVGAGAAGTWVAHTMQRARPRWSIELFERSNRIGGRLRSVKVPGLGHPIDLGGMRYLTSHRRVQSVVETFGIPTRPFDPRGGPERTFLRGHFGRGAADPESGRGYDLSDGERGRSALDLVHEAFLGIVPDAERLDASGWTLTRASYRYGGRPLIDWAIGEALAGIRSDEGHRFIVDAFGYDSGIRAFNVGDAIQFLFGGGDPSAEARVPIDGMDRIPNELAMQFVRQDGSIQLGREVRRLAVDEGALRLDFADGMSVVARHVVLALPIAALTTLAAESPALGTPNHRRLYEAVEGFPAAKLYLWYDRPWWRGTDGVDGIRMTTDLANRKVFYFDEDADAPALILAAYTDGQHTVPWVNLANGASDGSPAPDSMLEAARSDLEHIHPAAEVPPEPVGSAFMHWGSDPHEIGWSFWRAGFNSDEVMATALQPDPRQAVYLCGETFSRSQSWVEGALETAEAVTQRLLDAPG
jgi:monoamine oxidase